jgi:hypothetical protein
MSAHDRVVKIIASWARVSRAPNDTDQLQVLWATSGQAVPFQPDAATELIAALTSEFRKPPMIDVRISPSDFPPSGEIKTVEDLAIAVGQMPSRP